MSSITEHLVMEDMLHNLCLFFCFLLYIFVYMYSLILSIYNCIRIVSEVGPLFVNEGRGVYE